MNCEEARQLVDAYVDRELDLTASLRMEQHLETCGSCSLARDRRTALQKSIRTAGLAYTANDSLEKRVRTAIAKDRVPASPTLSDRVASGPRKRALPLWRWELYAAVAVVVPCLLLAVLLLTPSRWQGEGRGGVLTGVAVPVSSEQNLAGDVVASHIRSMMANHLSDVISTDQHTVKPWFDGKLDYAPPVTDLAAQGFPLAGGRLDYLDNRPVAALIYHRRLHIINLFVWPLDEPAQKGLTQFSRQGYNVVHWDAAGMTYWAASDVNAADLMTFANLLQAPPEPRAAPRTTE